MHFNLMSFAEEVLSKVKEPLTYQEIWSKGLEMGLEKKLSVKGKTPWQTLGARLYVDVRDNSHSKFIKVSKNPAKFFLKSRVNEIKPDDKIDSKIDKIKKEKYNFDEREIHPLLSYFAYSNLSFNHGKSILTKTIFHEKSLKKGYSEWLYPDLVGFYLPIKDWDENLLEFNRLSDNNALKIYSFEVKKSINRSNYREYYFQAVSNSSWAHEGYLVAIDIKEDDDLISELERLNMSFGIGIIKLDLNDIDSSKVLYPAHIRMNLDWETMNKLCEQNPDFAKFIKDVKIDFNSKVIHNSEYDEIIKNPESYIKKILKNKSSE